MSSIVQFPVNLEFDRVSNEDLVHQLMWLMKNPARDEEATNTTLAEVLRRMAGGEGWAHFMA